jgi:hypothetical protein
MGRMWRFIAVALALGLAGLVFANSAGAADPSSSTVINASYSQTLTSTNPCTGDSGTVLLTGREIAHVTDFGNGTFFIAVVDVGTLTVTDSSTAQVLTGPFATTYTFESTSPGLQYDVTGLFTTVATAADGSKVQYQLRVHRTRTPQGDYVVSYSIVSATCIAAG